MRDGMPKPCTGGETDEPTDIELQPNNQPPSVEPAVASDSRAAGCTDSRLATIGGRRGPARRPLGPAATTAEPLTGS